MTPPQSIISAYLPPPPNFYLSPPPQRTYTPPSPEALTGVSSAVAAPQASSVQPVPAQPPVSTSAGSQVSEFVAFNGRRLPALKAAESSQVRDLSLFGRQPTISPATDPLRSAGMPPTGPVYEMSELGVVECFYSQSWRRRLQVIDPLREPMPRALPSLFRLRNRPQLQVINTSGEPRVWSLSLVNPEIPELHSSEFQFIEEPVRRYPPPVPRSGGLAMTTTIVGGKIVEILDFTRIAGEDVPETRGLATRRPIGVAASTLNNVGSSVFESRDASPSEVTRRGIPIPRVNPYAFSMSRFATGAGVNLASVALGQGLVLGYEYYTGAPASFGERFVIGSIPTALLTGISVARGASLSSSLIHIPVGLLSVMPMDFGFMAAEHLLGMDTGSSAAVWTRILLTTAFSALTPYATIIGGASVISTGTLTAGGIGLSFLSGLGIGAAAIASVAVVVGLNYGIGWLVNQRINSLTGREQGNWMGNDGTLTDILVAAAINYR